MTTNNTTKWSRKHNGHYTEPTGRFTIKRCGPSWHVHDVVKGTCYAYRTLARAKKAVGDTEPLDVEDILEAWSRGL